MNRIIWHPTLLRPDLEGLGGQQLRAIGRFSSNKPSRLYDRLAPLMHHTTQLPVSWPQLLYAHSAQHVHAMQYVDHIEARYALAACGVHAYATLMAAEHGGAWAAPVSGFHHASFDSAWGYCTFNGLMVSAALALQLKEVDAVAILDGDTHLGDGCINILDHWRKTRRSYAEDKPTTYFTAERAEDVCSALHSLSRAYGTSRVLVMYQAGVDGHVDDPFGGHMTDEEYTARDLLVYNYCRDHGWPSVTNLAGGYTEHAIDLHQQTLERVHATSAEDPSTGPEPA